MNIIDYIVKNKGLKQKDIASMLNVSRAQVSKWKAGEAISLSKQEELNKMAGLFGDDSEWAIMAGTKKNANAWYKYFANVEQYGEEGYNTGDFSEYSNAQISVPSLLKTLQKLGVKIPKNVPAISDCESEDETETDIDTPFDSLICEFMTNYGYLVQWWEYATEWLEDSDLVERVENIRYGITGIALSHIEEETLARVGIDNDIFNKFVHEERVSLLKAIDKLCIEMMRRSYPITIDYFRLVSDHPYSLDDEVFGKQLFASIEDFTSIGEKKIAEEIREIKSQLNDLQQKIDKLIALQTTDTENKNEE